MKNEIHTELVLAEERNCYLVWRCNFDTVEIVNSFGIMTGMPHAGEAARAVAWAMSYAGHARAIAAKTAQRTMPFIRLDRV